MSPTLVWKSPPSGINVAGTWVCPTIVTFDLRTCQIAGCKKENSLITTRVRSWALHEPDGCAFCGCGASGCLWATHGTWAHWALSDGAGSGCCFCVAVSGCEHEDPLTRTAFRWLPLHLLQASSPSRAQGQADFAKSLGCQVSGPYSFDMWGSNSLAERATGSPRSQSQTCYSTLLLLEQEQQRGLCVLPWKLQMLTLIPVPVLWGNFSSDSLILESALLFWWLCLDACVGDHLASLSWARGMY